jgi:glyoxylase-like metal-dependent hydrolase (beta-lactamase superfamily II)
VSAADQPSSDGAPARARAMIIPVTPFQQNCTLIWNEADRRGAVVDPGGDLENIERAIEKEKVAVERILLTHGHVDHVGGAFDLRKKLKVPIEGPHEADQFLLDHVVEAGRSFGLSSGLRNVTPDRWLNDGDEVRVGDIVLEVLHCPGHSPGSVVFFCRAQRFAFVGDVLFNGSIGRTDFPGGDYDTLIRSIKTKLLPLGDDVAFISGHGPTSTFGQERAMNPFLR